MMKLLYHMQISIQAFNDEDPQGRRTIGNLSQHNDKITYFPHVRLVCNFDYQFLQDCFFTAAKQR